jgi:WXXGXW repeat (2 copies)
MQHVHRLTGIAAMALTAAALSACYPPPPQYGPTAASTVAPSGAGTISPIVAPFAPPPPQVETPPSSPSPAMVWQPGHWSWSWIENRYAWTPGNYVSRPTPTANWVPGYWQQGPSGWMWIEGRWA